MDDYRIFPRKDLTMGIPTKDYRIFYSASANFASVRW